MFFVLFFFLINAYPKIYLVRIRAALMFFTGDHPAQCKIGCLKEGGYGACRRCHMSQYLNVEDRVIGAVQYTNNRYQSRNPPPIRTVNSMYHYTNSWKEASTDGERLQVSNLGGITGDSPLWRLYHMYGFDISRDLVFDVMHTLSLNVFKKYVETFIERIGHNQSRKTEIENALNLIGTMRPKGLGQRWPKNPTTRLGFFKAEEYKNFVLWILPYLLDYFNVIDSHPELFKLGLILIELSRIYFPHNHTYGWTEDTIQSTKSLLQSWRIRSEDYMGPSGSVLEHVAGEHL